MDVGDFFEFDYVGSKDIEHQDDDENAGLCWESFDHELEDLAFFVVISFKFSQHFIVQQSNFNKNKEIIFKKGSELIERNEIRRVCRRRTG